MFSYEHTACLLFCNCSKIAAYKLLTHPWLHNDSCHCFMCLYMDGSVMSTRQHNYHAVTTELLAAITSLVIASTTYYRRSSTRSSQQLIGGEKVIVINTTGIFLPTTSLLLWTHNIPTGHSSVCRWFPFLTENFPIVLRFSTEILAVALIHFYGYWTPQGRRNKMSTTRIERLSHTQVHRSYIHS